MRDVYSTNEELGHIAKILSNYIRLPVSHDAIPGAFLEAVLAHVRNGERLNTYDYIDVLDQTNRVGWSIKSTKAATPVTWKRAKLPNQVSLIEASWKSSGDLQNLGNAIINFCNQHARLSMELYNLREIGYARLIMKENHQVVYFERRLCTQNSPDIFNPDDFTWQWSKQKTTTKKEQLSALHGIHKQTGRKWWAWHGLGENQLHFSGESNWWPNVGTNHTAAFALPRSDQRISFDELADLLEGL